MLSRAFGIEATFPRLDQLATSAEQKGGPFFSVDECVVVQNESHQNLTEYIFMIGFKKKTCIFGDPKSHCKPRIQSKL